MEIIDITVKVRVRKHDSVSSKANIHNFSQIECMI